MLVQIADRLGQSSMMGSEHGPAGRRVTQAVEDRDALGRPQDHIERGDGIAAMGAAQQLPGRRVAALEQGLELGHGCFALQPEARGADTVPPPWGLAVAGQILLVVGGQLAGVVLLPAHRELRDVGHHPPLSSRRRWRQQRTLGALLSSDDYGSRVERTAKRHPLWQAFASKGSVSTAREN
jgi:hypothetical protein